MSSTEERYLSFSSGKKRNSNLELFRILVMLFIIAHHYVVNSEVGILMRERPFDEYSIFYYLFGAWGKTGINCFVLITGYFMCTSRISLIKYVKLFLEIKFYQYIILAIFFIIGLSSINFKTILGILPFTIIGNSFTNAFMAFYLFIPYLNILIKELTKRSHFVLIILLLWIYTFLGMLQMTTFNYVSWFIVLYFISSYIRLYGLPFNNNTKLWGGMTLILIILSISSILSPLLIGMNPSYYFVSDSNSVFAILLSISSFMFFKNLKIGYSQIINTIGSTTFGVFLIHTRGNEMRHWLWYDLVDCGGHYDSSHYWAYAIVVVFAVFIVCSLIDWIRINSIEKWTFKILTPWLKKIENIILSKII